jgi:hypothetical protein
MMYEFCVGLGYCGCVKDGKPLHVSDFIPETGPASADQFTRWLLEAEGFELDEFNVPGLSAVFMKHMGADVVDVSTLRSEYPGA